MNILERTISAIAPNVCLVCGSEGNLLCEPCSLSSIKHHPSRCYRCHKATKQSKVCPACYQKARLSHVWVVSEYGDIAKQLVYKLKFARAQSASSDIARVINDVLPILPESIIITNVPTASGRIRRRGYDQAQEIARSLAVLRGWEYKPLLIRVGTTRQVGSTRQNRFKQLENAFSVRNKNLFAGSHILLIDDVLTTGATIESAAKTLKQNCAKTVDAAVFAQS